MKRLTLFAALVALALGSIPAGAQQPALTKISVGGVFSDDMTPVFYAQKAGLFRKEGLDVTIVPATSGAAMTAAVLSGTYEFGKSSLLAAVNAHLKNLPLAVIASGA